MGARAHGRGRGGPADGGQQRHGLVRRPQFEKRLWPGGRAAAAASAAHGRGSEGRGRAKGCGRGARQKPRARTALGVREDGVWRHQQLPEAHAGAITAICVTHEAVYTASRDKLLRRWRPERRGEGSFELVAEKVVPLEEACWCMVPAGQWLFCGLSNGSIRAFVKSGEHQTLTGHTDGVSAMLVHQDVLLTGSAEGAVRCWRMDGQSQTFVNVHTVAELIPGQVRCLAVTPGQLWIGSAKGLSVVELASLARSARVGPETKVNDLLEFQGHVIVAYADGSMTVFDEGGCVKHSQPPLAAGPIICLAGLESGPRLLCGHARGEVSAVELPSFQLLCSWRALEGCPARCLSSARHEGLFLVGGETGDLQLWQRGCALAAAAAEEEALPTGPEEVTDGAPLCACGRVCRSSPALPNKGWRCKVCGAKREGERWLCVPCQDSICRTCFPLRRMDDKGAAGQRESEFASGRWVHVKKHSSMGCAVVTFNDPKHRDQLLAQVRSEALVLGGIGVDMKPHMEKQGDGTRMEVPDCLFAGWKQPKEPGACRLLARTLQARLDCLCDALCPAISLDDD